VLASAIHDVGRTPLASIVDDDESVRIATKGLLGSLGWRAHTFASAEEFLDSPSVNGSSCLIIDMQMLGMNGVELQQALRKGSNGITSLRPFVFVTAAMLLSCTIAQAQSVSTTGMSTTPAPRGDIADGNARDV
jgi:FixJ family two-component response regulator